MSDFTKKDLEHLAKLARIELKGYEEETMLRDLKNILDYFEELKELNTENVPPMTGGTELKSILRDDQMENEPLDGTRAKEAFPESEDGYLKIPPVFE